MENSFVKLLMNKFIFILLAALTLTGCRMDTNVELYLGDVVDVAGQGQDELRVTSGGTLSIHVMSRDECEKNKPEIISIVSKYIDNVVDQGCKSVEMNDFLELSVDYPISMKDEGTLIQLMVSSGEKFYNVDYMMNSDEFDGLNSEISEAFSEEIEIKESTVSLTIVNDLKIPYVLNITSAFVDGKPIILGSKILKKRRTMDMIFSSVYSSKLAENYRIHLVSIGK